jgi:hypothetical protein
MDRLADAMVAGLHLIATSWLKGVTAYGLAMHGFVPDPNLYGKSPSTDDEKDSAHESDGDHGGALSSYTIGHGETAEAFSPRSSAITPTVRAADGLAGQPRAVTAAPFLSSPPYEDRD